MSTTVLFLQPCSSETFACIFSMEAPTSPQKRPRFDGGSDVLCHVLHVHARIPTCLGDTQLDPDFMKKVAPLLRDLRKSQTNLSFTPLERKSAFLKLAQKHQQTWGFDDEDVENVAVDAGIRLGKVRAHGASQLRRPRLPKWITICSKPVLFASMTHSPSERWRVLELPSTGSLAGAQTKKIAFRVASMFVTDGKPNMQHAKFTEELRDDGSNGCPNRNTLDPVIGHEGCQTRVKTNRGC